MTTLSAKLFIAPLVEFITGKVIEAGTSGDVTKQAARATELLAINSAIMDIDEGNVAGTAALAAALNTSALSPGEGLALQSLFATLGSQMTLINSLLGSTIVGTAATAIANSILDAADTVCQAYIAKASTTSSTAAATKPATPQ